MAPLSAEATPTRSDRFWMCTLFLALRIADEGGDIAVKIRPAGDEAVGIVAKRFCAQAFVGDAGHLAGFDHVKLGHEVVAVLVAQGIGDRRGTVGIVSHRGQFGAAGMLR